LRISNGTSRSYSTRCPSAATPARASPPPPPARLRACTHEGPRSRPVRARSPTEGSCSSTRLKSNEFILPPRRLLHGAARRWLLVRRPFRHGPQEVTATRSGSAWGGRAAAGGGSDERLGWRAADGAGAVCGVSRGRRHVRAFLLSGPQRFVCRRQRGDGANSEHNDLVARACPVLRRSQPQPALLFRLLLLLRA
jgi:hypothetical protein